jgi:hypothetical protein
VQRRERDSAHHNRIEELKLQTFLNTETTKEEVEDIAEQIWKDPTADHRLHRSCLALRMACINHTLGNNPKDDDKFIRQADALRNRGE